MEPEIAILLEVATKKVEADRLNDWLFCLLKEKRESLIGYLCNHYKETKAKALSMVEFLKDPHRYNRYQTKFILTHFVKHTEKGFQSNF